MNRSKSSKSTSSKSPKPSGSSSSSNRGLSRDSPNSQRHCEGLTEELIKHVKDPFEFRKMFINFYRKFNKLEKECEKREAAAALKLNQEAESKNEAFKQELFKQVLDAVEQDFCCSICSEIYIQPAALDCAHTFCNFCITKWRKEQSAGDAGKECPVCRNFTISQPSKHTGIDSFVNKIYTMMSQDIQNKREEVIRDRNREEITAAAAARANSEVTRDRDSMQQRILALLNERFGNHHHHAVQDDDDDSDNGDGLEDIEMNEMLMMSDGDGESDDSLQNLRVSDSEGQVLDSDDDDDDEEIIPIISNNTVVVVDSDEDDTDNNNATPPPSSGPSNASGAVQTANANNTVFIDSSDSDDDFVDSSRRRVSTTRRLILTDSDDSGPEATRNTSRMSRSLFSDSDSDDGNTNPRIRASFFSDSDSNAGNTSRRTRISDSDSDANVGNRRGRNRVSSTLAAIGTDSEEEEEAAVAQAAVLRWNNSNRASERQSRLDRPQRRASTRRRRDTPYERR